jgi:hypothetical protein
VLGSSREFPYSPCCDGVLICIEKPWANEERQAKRRIARRLVRFIIIIIVK